MILRKVAYDQNSTIGSVQACLKKKIEVSKNVNGIGPKSCCSFISYIHDDKIDNIFGNSRIRVPFQVTRGAFTEARVACVHGELNALWNVLEDTNTIPQIMELYIEMSPCTKCSLALNNLLPSDLIVYYSFDHPSEVDQWGAAATALCK